MSNFYLKVFLRSLEPLCSSKIPLANCFTFLEISQTVNTRRQKALVHSEDPQTGLQITYKDGRLDLGKFLQLKDSRTGGLISTQLYGGKTDR